jgi:hypothetical protein
MLFAPAFEYKPIERDYQEFHYIHDILYYQEYIYQLDIALQHCKSVCFVLD